MTRRPPRNQAPVFKIKAARAAIKGEKILAELARRFDVRANQITQWRSQLLYSAADAFHSGTATVDGRLDVNMAS